MHLGECQMDTVDNGYRKFIKPPFSILRRHGYLSVTFVDGSCLQGHTFSRCEENVNATVYLFQSLGFTIHPAKSILVPPQETEFLGFILDSLEMKIKLTDYRAGKVISKIKKLLHEEK